MKPSLILIAVTLLALPWQIQGEELRVIFEEDWSRFSAGDDGGNLNRDETWSKIVGFSNQYLLVEETAEGKVLRFQPEEDATVGLVTEGALPIGNRTRISFQITPEEGNPGESVFMLRIRDAFEPEHGYTLILRPDELRLLATETYGSNRVATHEWAPGQFASQEPHLFTLDLELESSHHQIVVEHNGEDLVIVSPTLLPELGGEVTLEFRTQNGAAGVLHNIELLSTQP